jgi:transcriptional regulator with XRE-family HTH domain
VSKHYSTSYVIAMLRMLIAKEGSQAKLARKLKVSQAYLSDVLQCRRDPGPSILEPLGFTQRVVYVRKP